MKSFIKARNTKRHRRVRFQIRVEGLEQRFVLSAGLGSQVPAVVSPFDSTTPLPPNLTVAGLDPIFGTTTTNGNVSITITFDRPIDPGSLDQDFDIDQIDAFGNETPVENLGTYINETPGPDGESVIITTTQPLSPGLYDVILFGGAGVTGLDGSSVSMNNQTLGTFTVATPDVTLADATSLGSPIGSPITVTDQLDPSSPPNDVKLYQISLPDTHTTWQLGLEVDAAAIGSSLLTTLALFDANGTVVATSQTGRSNDPNDPFLFTGVKPGVYYVGVSPAGDVPGTPSGYNPVTGLGGQDPASAAAGAFELSVVADPADTPTQVKTFDLNYADPTDTTPTGLTLQFNNELNEVSLNQASSTAIKLIDGTGKVWTLHSTSYDESTSTVTFEFDDILPAGTYSVVLGGAGQLVNLANEAPVSAGYPDGTLAMFQVGPAQVRTSPYNLGPVPLHEVTKGISRTLHLAANQSETYRVVIEVPGIYDLQTTYTGGTPTMYATVDGTQVGVDSGVAGVLGRHDLELPAGLVTYTLTAGSKASTINLLFKLSASQAEQLLINGVGQSSELSLRLIDPSAILAGFAPASGPGIGPSTDGQGIVSTGSTSTVVSPTTFGGAIVASPVTATSSPSTSTSDGSSTVSALLVTQSAGLVGHPSTMNDLISVVGSVSPGGQTSLAYNGAGLPFGLNGRSNGLDRANKPLINGEMFSLNAPNESELVDQDLVRASGELVTEARAKPTEVLVPENTLLERVAGIVSRWFPNESRGDQTRASADLDEKALAQLDRGKASNEHEAPTEELVETADLSHSFGIGVVVVGLAVIHRKAVRWLERKRRGITAKLSTN